MHEVKPLEGRRLRGHRPPPRLDAARAEHRITTYTAEQVIVCAHAYGSASYCTLRRTGTLPACRTSGRSGPHDSEQLILVARPYDGWKHDPERIHITPDRWRSHRASGPTETSIEPVYYGVGSDLMALYHLSPGQRAEAPSGGWLKALVERQREGPRLARRPPLVRAAIDHSCMRTSDPSIELYWHDGMLRSQHGSGPPPDTHIPVVEAFADRLAAQLQPYQHALTSSAEATTSAHFMGGVGSREHQHHVINLLPARVRPSRACT